MTMIQLVLYPQQNRVYVNQAFATDLSKEAPFQFQRRWECQILSMLLLEGQAGRALNSNTLQQTLRQKGQLKDLNRAQLQRLFNSLNVFLASISGQPLQLKIAPRQATVGPWTLIFSAAVSFYDAEIFAPVNTDQNTYQYPRLLAIDYSSGDTKVEVCVDSLYFLLSQLLSSDAFSLIGNYRESINTLQDIDKSQLTEEAQALIWIKESTWQKRLGHFKTARLLVKKVLDNSPKLDPGIANYAQLLLHRIDYDESPAHAHEALWHSASLPQLVLQSDWRSLSEWHNLRALLSRRRLIKLYQSIKQSKNGQNYENITQDETPESLNQYALNHLQSAIYWALQYRDWDRLQAYICNVAFHLQEMLPFGFVNVNQVFNWHRLILSCTDKLNLAQDSAWEYIFFGEFWLNHHAIISYNTKSDSVSHLIDDVEPSQEAFYLQGLDKLTACADARQIAIMWVLYGRYATEHLGVQAVCDNYLLAGIMNLQKLLTLEFIKEALTELLQQNSGLRQTLFDEGYAEYLPIT